MASTNAAQSASGTAPVRTRYRRTNTAPSRLAASDSPFSSVSGGERAVPPVVPARSP